MAYPGEEMLATVGMEKASRHGQEIRKYSCIWSLELPTQSRPGGQLSSQKSAPVSDDSQAGACEGCAQRKHTLAARSTQSFLRAGLGAGGAAYGRLQRTRRL